MTRWSWTQSKMAPDIMRKNDIICPPPSIHQSSHWVRLTEWLDWWMRGERDRPSVDVQLHWYYFCSYSEAWKVNSHCWINVPTCNCCATVPTGHSCLLYWLIYLSTQSTNWLQLCVRWLQTSETESSHERRRYHLLATLPYIMTSIGSQWDNVSCSSCAP